MNSFLRAGSLGLLVIGALPVFAASTEIPTSLLGTHYVTFDGNSFPGANLIGGFPGGYGGAFQANIYPDAADTNGVSVRPTVWCVDYQLDVGSGSSYIANITPLSGITTPTDNSVRYGNIDSGNPASGPNWANALPGPANEVNTAAYRYTLTAWLVSQYDNSNNQIQPDNPVNSDRNKAIQTAIWYLTYNTDYNPGATWAPYNPSDYGAGNYSYWVSQAEANVNSVNLADWAVISGPALANGALQSPAGGYQTFLVGVESPAPEPGFYGLVALGLAGLFGAARARNRKSGPAQN